jgi:hypothetical protein
LSKGASGSINKPNSMAEAAPEKIKKPKNKKNPITVLFMVMPLANSSSQRQIQR